MLVKWHLYCFFYGTSETFSVPSLKNPWLTYSNHKQTANENNCDNVTVVVIKHKHLRENVSLFVNWIGIFLDIILALGVWNREIRIENIWKGTCIFTIHTKQLLCWYHVQLHVTHNIQQNMYRNVSSLSHTKFPQMFLVSSCSYLCPIHWSHALSHEWRCRWNYNWVISKFMANWGASYIKGLTYSIRWLMIGQWHSRDQVIVHSIIAFKWIIYWYFWGPFYIRLRVSL